MTTSVCHKCCRWISEKHTSFEIFSFLSDLEGCKQFLAVFSERKATGAQNVDCYVHIHLDIHKPVESNSGVIVYMHFLLRLHFSPRKNTLEKTVIAANFVLNMS